MKISVSKLDSQFSKMVRAKRPICEVCKVRSSSQVHHFYGRRMKSVRFDEKNIIALCFTCHRKFHENPSWAIDWMKRKLGDRELSLLTIKANTPGKPDYEMLKIYFKNCGY